MAIKLIDDFHLSWKMFSVQIAIAISFFNIAYQQIALIQAYIPSEYYAWINFVLGILVWVGRIIKQKQRGDVLLDDDKNGVPDIEEESEQLIKTNHN